jgi:hypothetical protein
MRPMPRYRVKICSGVSGYVDQFEMWEIPLGFAQDRLSPAGENAGLRDDPVGIRGKLTHHL